jgi:hypothetical protein
MDLRPAAGRKRLTGNGRLSELFAPDRPVIYAFQRQQSGVDFVYLSTRHRPKAEGHECLLWGSQKVTPGTVHPANAG